MYSDMPEAVNMFKSMLKRNRKRLNTKNSPLFRVFYCKKNCNLLLSKGGFMAWQGVPFMFNHSQITDYGFLHISRIPGISVTTNSEFGWDTVLASVLGALIAAALPAAIAWWSIRKNIRTLKEDRQEQQSSFDKDRKAQVEIAKQNINAQVLSSNRQAWINELRNVAAEFAAKINRITVLHLALNEIKSGTIQNEDFGTYIHESLTEQSNLSYLSHKIRFLLNPDEERSKKVFNIIGGLKIQTDMILKSTDRQITQDINELSGQFVDEIQKILKEEWERVKKNE